MQDHVDYFVGKQQFGIDNYEPRKTHDNMVPPRHFLQGKQKRDTFMTSIPKITGYVPAPSKYDTCFDWL